MWHLFPIVLLALAGMVIWFVRLRPVLVQTAPPDKGHPDVSIIVPARNEAHNLPALLKSLRALDPPAREIIVVDDHSSDATAQVARGFGVTVLTPAPLPEDWNGKPWACQAGADHATGAFLLFTDADTVHAPNALAHVAAVQKESGAALLSVIPTHTVVAPWERLQGVFHLLLLIASGAGAKVAAGERRYAIGQYLLLSRATYERIGGHRAVRRRIAEDLAMARAVVESGALVETLLVPGLLRVRMYPAGLRAFIAGWRRSFYEGMSSAGGVAALEVTLVIGWLLGAPLLLVTSIVAGDTGGIVLGGGLFMAAGIAIARSQRLLGDFSPRTAWAYPIFVVIFSMVSLLAVVDRVRGMRPSWKGRQVLSKREGGVQ